MNKADKYIKLIEWSDEDNCFIGSCPELFYGGCHGEDELAVFAELCQIVEETVDLYEQNGKTLPEPLSGKGFVNAMQMVC